MKFCQHCENMMYVSVEKENLVYYCKHCNNKETQDVALDESVVIIDDNKIDDATRYSHYINKFLKYDPTLPRVNNIVCVNKSCSKKEDEQNEVIYLKYDHANMQYLYYCCHCDHFWKQVN
jgi:DNA-directed RNA polymerase subunit M/transcription elongation factor TFIIS